MNMLILIQTIVVFSDRVHAHHFLLVSWFISDWVTTLPLFKYLRFHISTYGGIAGSAHSHEIKGS